MAQKISKGFIYLLLIILTSCNSSPKTPIIFEVISNTIELNCHIPDRIEKYRWQSHWLLLTDKADSAMVHKALNEIYPNTNIHIYSKPFYNFNIKENCQKKYSKNFKNYIFTANLVSDTTLQREYFEYHEKQTSEWPEIAEGFCNADFQQLLVYNNGRQLILIITTPGDKTLNELNPKTVENNPRMVEWNNKMTLFQEGLNEAPEGTVWVEFNKIK